MAITLHNAVNGSQTASNTSAETITLPTYSAGDVIVMVVGRNGTSTSYTGDAHCTVTAIALGDGSLSALKITPDGTNPTTFTLTASQAKIWRWWIASYSGVSGTIYGTQSAIGSNTTATMAVPTTSLGYVNGGNEYAISAGGVNATATWTTDANTLYNNTTDNASILVSGKTIATGLTAVAFAAIDRGLAGTSRIEATLSFVLPVAGVTTNLLANPSFEAGTTIATSWTDEHTTVGSATYSLAAIGVFDGDLAQRIVYNGQAGDGGTKILEIYQAPVTGMVAGDRVTFGVYLSGTLTNTPTIIGVEAFTSGNAYISETDTYITGISGTPTYYEVTYTCPANTDHVAVYLQCQEIGATTIIDVRLDSARLTNAGPAPISKSAFFALF